MEKNDMMLLIGEAALKNVTFSGLVGNNTYNVCDLIHSVHMSTLDSMYIRLNKELKSLDSESLSSIVSNSSSTRKQNALKNQLEIIKAIYTYKHAEAERLANEKEARERRKEKFALLEKVKSKKEMERYETMSLEDLEKEIASL